MCPLQIINDNESLSLTLHGVNAHFIYNPSNVKNYSNNHKSKTSQPKILTTYNGYNRSKYASNLKFPIITH